MDVAKLIVENTGDEKTLAYIQKTLQRCLMLLAPHEDGVYELHVGEALAELRLLNDVVSQYKQKKYGQKGVTVL